MEVPKGPGTFTVSGAPGSSPNPPTSPGAGAPASASDEEATWRSRAAKLRADLAQAQKDYDAADRANTVVSFGRPGHDYETLLAIRNAALAPYVMRLEEVQTALAALPEECRRAHGCQPGWVR